MGGICPSKTIPVVLYPDIFADERADNSLFFPCLGYTRDEIILTISEELFLEKKGIVKTISIKVHACFWL